MKLIYWVCEITDDAACYNIRARTKREAEQMRHDHGQPERFKAARKVVFEYKDAFDLVTSALNEGGHSYIEGC